MLSSHNPGELLPEDLAAFNPWARRLLFLRILFISVLLIGILFWLLSFVINPILILLVAALLAYPVVPVIDLLHRVMPRALETSDGAFGTAWSTFFSTCVELTNRA